MTERKDVDLNDGSGSSRAYRAESGDMPPPDRSRKPTGWLMLLALAASLALAVNLAWNLHEHAPPPLVVAAEKAAAPATSPAPPAETAEQAVAAAAGARGEQNHAMQAESHPKLAKSGLAKSGSSPRTPAAKTMPPELKPVPISPPPPPPPLNEPDKIERLIQYVGNLQGAVFIRNGSEHTAAEAADHLHLKLKNAGNRVQTAEDFIELCGTRSSLTRKEYRIRLADGRTLPSAELLRARLKEIEAGTAR